MTLRLFAAATRAVFLFRDLCLATRRETTRGSGQEKIGGDETVQQTKSTTTGQELQDLNAAYDKGIISEREYNQQRDKILKGQ